MGKQRPGEETFIEVSLLTGDRRLVSKEKIPAFQKMPEIVIWGGRAFVHTTTTHYREAMAYHIPPPAVYKRPTSQG